jgi:hypothetical protein
LNDTLEVKNALKGEGAASDSIMVGVFGACPVDQNGMVCYFS